MLLSLVGVSGMVKEAPSVEFMGVRMVFLGSRMGVSVFKLPEPAHFVI